MAIDEEEFVRLVQAHGLELFGVANKYAAPLHDDESPIEDKVTLMRARCLEMIDIIKEHKRVWDYHAGEQVKPKTHHSAVVLKGEFGGGGAM